MLNYALLLSATKLNVASIEPVRFFCKSISMHCPNQSQHF